MSDNFIKRNIELSLEFDKYVLSHPKLFSQIPNGAIIVLTIKGDEAFSRQSIALVSNTRSKRPKVEAQKDKATWNLRELASSA